MSHDPKQPINRQPKRDSLFIKFNQFKILHATENSGSTVFDLNTGAVAHSPLCAPFSCLLYCQLELLTKATSLLMQTASDFLVTHYFATSNYPKLGKFLTSVLYFCFPHYEIIDSFAVRCDILSLSNKTFRQKISTEINIHYVVHRNITN